VGNFKQGQRAGSADEALVISGFQRLNPQFRDFPVSKTTAFKNDSHSWQPKAVIRDPIKVNSSQPEVIGRSSTP
jgi:hypothetical protein